MCTDRIDPAHAVAPAAEEAALLLALYERIPDADVRRAINALITSIVAQTERVQSLPPQL